MHLTPSEVYLLLELVRPLATQDQHMRDLKWRLEDARQEIMRGDYPVR